MYEENSKKIYYVFIDVCVFFSEEFSELDRILSGIFLCYLSSLRLKGVKCLFCLFLFYSIDLSFIFIILYIC